MALELIKISEFPQVTEPSDWVVVSGSDGVAYKISQDDFKAWLGTVQTIAPKSISPTDPEPGLSGLYIPSEDGDYPLIGLDVDRSEGGADEGMYVQFINDNGTWSKVNTPLPEVDTSGLVANSDLNITTGKNLFDKNQNFTAGQIDAETGDPVSANEFLTTNFIPIPSPGQYHGQSTGATYNSMRRIARYDTNKMLIPDSSGNTGTTDISLNEDVKYIKISIHETSLDNFQLEAGSDRTEYEPYSADIDKIKNIPVAASKLFDGAVINQIGESGKSVINKEYVEGQGFAKATEGEASGNNLFDFSNMLEDKYINTSTGALSDAAGWQTSLPMVVSSPQVTISNVEFPNGRPYRWLDANGDLVAGAFGNFSIAANPMPSVLNRPAGAAFLQISVLKNGESLNFDNLMVNGGSEPLPFEPYISNSYTEKINGNYIGAKYLIDSAGNLVPEKQLVRKSDLGIDGIELIVDESERSEINYTCKGNAVKQVFRSNRPLSPDQSNVFDWVATYLNGNLVHQMSDETAPYRIEGTTIGANHGYMKTRITSAGHGKTNEDVGSVWSDGQNEFVIVNIVDSSRLDVSSRADNSALTASLLTHVSGATNTGSINTSVKSHMQMYPCFKNRDLKIYIDGTLIEGEGAFSAKDNVTYSESYDILDKSSIIEWLIGQVGTSEKIIAVNGTSIARVNNTFTFDKEMGCTTVQSFLGLDDTPRAFQDIMFVMNNPIKENPVRTVYIPKSLPFTHESVNYDFRVPQEVSAALSTRINITPDRADDTGIFCDRRIEFSGNIGYAIGFLPVEDAGVTRRREVATRKALQISESEKTYMSAIDSTSVTEFSKGDYYSVTGYRKYFFREGGASSYTIPSGQGTYLYLDWHDGGDYEVNLPEQLIGKPFEVVEKSDNVDLYSKSATKNINGSVDINESDVYGYLVLRF